MLERKKDYCLLCLLVEIHNNCPPPPVLARRFPLSLSVIRGLQEFLKYFESYYNVVDANTIIKRNEVKCTEKNKIYAWK